MKYGVLITTVKAPGAYVLYEAHDVFGQICHVYDTENLILRDIVYYLPNGQMVGATYTTSDLVEFDFYGEAKEYSDRLLRCRNII